MPPSLDDRAEIMTRSIPVNCPRCGKEVPTGDVNVIRMLAKCNACAKIFYFSDSPGLTESSPDSTGRLPSRDGGVPANRPDGDAFAGLTVRRGLKIPISTALEGKDLQKSGITIRKVSEDEILGLLQRHPCNNTQIELALGGSPQVVAAHLERLKKRGMISENRDGFWVTT